MRLSLPFFRKTDAAAFLHSEISQRLLERLDFILLQPKNLLILNSGVKTKNKLLAQRYPAAKINAVANSIPFALPNHSVELVFANLLTTNRQELPLILAEVKRILTPDGLLMLSTLGPDTLIELRQSWIQNNQTPQPFIDMHDLGDMLLQSKFTDPVTDMEKITLTYMEPAKLFSDLASFAAQLLELDLKNLALQQQLITPYQAFADLEGKLPATFEVIYAHAWGSPQIASPPPTETHIPVSSLRGKIRKA